MNEHSKLDTGLQEEKAHRIAALIAGYIYKGLTQTEREELNSWVVESDEHSRLFKDLTNQKAARHALDWLSDADGPRMLNKINGTLIFTPPVQPSFFTRFRYHIVAASVILALALLCFLLLKNHPKQL